MNNSLIILFFIFSHSFAFAEQISFSELFVGLTRQSPPEVVEKNLKALEKGGVDSINYLVTQLSNKTLAHDSFKSPSRATVDRSTGTAKFIEATLGDVAFDLIVLIIEGRIPRSFRDKCALSPDNAKEWILARKGKNLTELQVEAAQITYNRAVAMNIEDQSEFSRYFLDYAAKRLNRLAPASK